EAFERICGISPKSPRWNDKELDCTKRCWKVLEDAVSKHRTVQEYRIACDHAHKTHGVIVLNISPLKGKDDTPLGAVMVIRDITRLTSLERELQERNQYHNIVGRSTRMQEIYTLLENLKDIDTTVLITGA